MSYEQGIRPILQWFCLGIALGQAQISQAQTTEITVQGVRISETDARPPGFTAEQTLIPDDPDSWRIESLVDRLPSAQVDVSNAGLSSALILRGFQIAQFFANSLPDDQRLFVRDLSTVESVRVIDGAKGVAFGLASPSGAVDYQLKQARMNSSATLQTVVGEHAFVRSTLDVGAGLHAASGDWAGRAVLAAQGGRSEPGALPQGRDNLLLTGSWWPSARQQLSIDLEQQHDRSPFSFGTVIDNGLDNSPGVHSAHVRYDQVYIAPGGAPAARGMERAALRWRHELGADWVAQAAAQTVRAFRDETLLGFWTLLSPTQLSGYYTSYLDHYRQDNLRLTLSGVEHGRFVDHRLSAGLDLNHDAWLFTGVQNIDGFKLAVETPDFSAVNTAALALSPRYNAESQLDSGVWLDDEMELSRSWFVDLGARRARYEIASDRSGAGLLGVAHGVATVHQAGLRWQEPSSRASWRLAWNEGLQPNRGQTHDGDFLPPQRTAALETGVSLAWLQAAEVAINAWRTDLQDLAMRDPLDRNAYVSTGSRRVLGIEASWSWHRAPWTLHAQASALATRQLVATTSTLGDQFVGVARRLAGLRAEWRDAQAQRWWISLSGVGPRFADGANQFLLAGYVKADAGIERRLSPHVELGFTLRNLGDQRYVSGVTAVDNVYQGGRRSAFLTLRLDS